MIRAQGLAMLFASVLRTWVDDDDEGHARTWRRSTARSRAASAGPASSTILCRIPAALLRHRGAAGAPRRRTKKRSRRERYTGTRTVARRPPSGEFAERDVAAVRARDVARDGEAEAGAALVLVARIVEAQERLEHLLAQVRRDARAVVVDRDGEPAVIAVAGDRDRGRKARGVRHEIGEAALERRRPHGDDRMAVELDIGGVAVALGVGLELVEEGRHVGRRRLLAGIAAREGEIGLEHAAHLVDVLLHRLDLAAVAEQRELELEAREDGAQVVRDAGEHRGALLHGALDAALHLDEGDRGAAHLARAARAEIRHFAALAEALGGVGEPQDRADLVAQEGDRDGEQHRRGADHPEQEDFRVRRIGGAAAREHAHHRIVELDADLDQLRAADGVDPERLADALADPFRERLVEQREERLRPRRRQFGHRQEVDRQAELVRTRCAGSARDRRPADRSRRCRSAPRCPAPRRPRAAA